MVKGVRRAACAEASPVCRQMCRECWRGPGTPNRTLLHQHVEGKKGLLTPGEVLL